MGKRGTMARNIVIESHAWATRAARSGTDPFALQEAGGWNSLTMPRRYIELAEVANQGVKLE